LKRTAYLLAAVVGAVVGVIWSMAISAGSVPHWSRWPALVTCPFIPLIGSRPANLLVAVLNAAAYWLVAWLIMRFLPKRAWYAFAAVIGASFGIFWLIAIDSGVNGASWTPNWRHWAWRITCPFTPLVGLSDLANVLVPVLNAALYVAVVWSIMRLRRSPTPVGTSTPKPVNT
jgi:hypothetical protein